MYATIDIIVNMFNNVQSCYTIYSIFQYTL